MNNNEAHLSVVLNVPSDYTGRVLVYLEKGRVKCQCRLMENEFISTLAGFSEMLTKSGVSADQLRGGRLCEINMILKTWHLKPCTLRKNQGSRQYVDEQP
ncbi:hypothetical protein [Escherichia coli]|uniref:hypothetical protein n=1 Tax=Escherichia coli TaxID=562 RepID=UPI001E2E2A2D|nr:hypothetical protein [Escherichia coli]UEO25848.1 hypothetical protein K9U09_03780 [Escherichia coli]